MPTTPTESNWHNAPLSRIELVKVIEHCNDASTEAACLLTDCAHSEILERLDTVGDSLHYAVGILGVQRRAYRMVAAEVRAEQRRTERED